MKEDARTPSPDNGDNLARIIDSVVDGLPPTFTVGELREVLTDAYRQAQDAERRILGERARGFGFETLTTDTRGHRTAEWFGKTGLAFSAGMASNAFAAAVYHPEVGIGASLVNAKTVEDVVEVYVRASRILDNGIPIGEKSYITPSPDNLSSRAGLAVREAFEEFALAGQGRVPAEGSEVIVYGMEGLPSPLASVINGSIARTISSLPLLSQCGVRNVRFTSHLGLIGDQLVYGGKNHPQFSFPRFVKDS